MSTEVEEPQNRTTFCELAEVNSLEELCRLEPDDISELVDQYPNMAATLIEDLLYELYLRANTNTTH